jgi:hypothetical protein
MTEWATLHEGNNTPPASKGRREMEGIEDTYLNPVKVRDQIPPIRFKPPVIALGS